MKSTSIFILTAFILTAIIAACSQNTLRIGNAVNLCCPGSYADYHSFSVETKDLPLFMNDYVVSEFSSAFEEKGLTRNDQVHDLRVVLSYRHINLNAEQQHIDPFVRQPVLSGAGPDEDTPIELRYIATIDITIHETATDKIVWAGEVHRIHTVSPGEYMHTPRAITAFRETFRNLLQHYPAPLADE